MLKFRGHNFLSDGVCACCIGDARVVAIDPTGTGSIRTAFNSALAIRWRGLRALVRTMIAEQDVLSMGSRGLMAIANPSVMGGATKIQMFQRWFDHVAQAQLVGGDGSWIREYIARGYAAGQQFAQRETGTFSVSRYAGDREQAIFQLAVVELQGIIEAVSQQAVRAVASGLLHGQRPNAIIRAVQSRIDTVGMSRSTAMVELVVVKAFGEATLDTYEAAGVTRVGLLPEQLLLGDAKKKRAKRLKPTGRAGTRSRKTPGGPGERTVQRIRRHERSLEVFPLVNVLTAGDKKVCQVCKKLARGGPYKINRARSLVPAHPRCRCVFIPALFQKDEWDPDQPRDPQGRWSETGAGGGKGKDFVVAHHGTLQSTAKSIQKKGIVLTAKGKASRKRFSEAGTLYKGERGESVFVTNNEQTALEYATGRAKGGKAAAVVTLHIPKDEWTKFKNDELEKSIAFRGGVKPKSAYSRKSIPPEWIHKINSYPNWAKGGDYTPVNLYTRGKKTKDSINDADDYVTMYIGLVLEDFMENGS